MPIDNSFESLNPRFQPIARAIIEVFAERVIPLRFPNFKVKVLETLRTAERQADVLAAGASKLKTGWHNYGLAMDVAIFDDHGVYITDGNHQAYAAIGSIASALGCIWGGSWQSFKDSGHVEWHPNVTLAQFESFLAAGKAATEIIST